MADKLKVVENGYSLLTGDPVYQIANAEDEVVDVGPYTKKEADAALKALAPKKAEPKKEPAAKKAPAKKATAKKTAKK
tara:strand:- start:510 stop:743 length:234 start_codon:yes stop_codon:yes gene_type:complete